MNSKYKWSSIIGIILLLVSYTHCDLLLTPTSLKYKETSTTSISNDSGVEISNTSVDYGNAYSYYEDIVKPKIDSQQCLLCHSTDGGAPLSIKSYDGLKSLLMDGSSYTNSVLNRKMIGTLSHGGGVKCSTNSTDICDDFSVWYSLEFSQNNEPSPVEVTEVGGGVLGSVDIVSALGKINGWGADSFNPNSSLTIEFYIDGAKGTGSLIGSTVANLPGGTVSGNHGYIFYIPSEYRDGNTHQLFAYAVDLNGNEVSLNGSPKTITTYKPNLSGYSYYQESVKPLLESKCIGCHAVSYDQHFNSLLSPTPAGGGDATDNEMINMPSGAHNNQSHPGGNICGDKDSSPCLEIQKWWQAEFN